MAVGAAIVIEDICGDFVCRLRCRHLFQFGESCRRRCWTLRAPKEKTENRTHGQYMHPHRKILSRAKAKNAFWTLSITYISWSFRLRTAPLGAINIVDGPLRIALGATSPLSV